jgi:hypothetical protein
MGDEIERSRQDEISIDISTPPWFPATLRVAYARRWEKRGKAFVENTAEYADTTEDALFQRAQADEAYGDVFMSAGRGATETSDVDLQDVFARLAAAAFGDDAKVDTVSYMLGLVEQLAPVHLRLLRELDQLDHGRRLDAVYLRTTGALMRNADPGVVPAALFRLEGLGLVERAIFVTQGPAVSIRDRAQQDQWWVSPLGRELLVLTQESAPTESERPD